MADDDNDLKKEFAREWLKSPDEPFRAAYRMFPGDFNRACVMGAQWQRDPVVLAEMRRIREMEPAASALPTREDIAQEILTLARSDTLKPEQKFQGYRLASELLGFVQKPGQTATNGTAIVQSVMRVPVHATEGDWEAAAAKQQSDLTKAVDDGATKH